MTEVDPAPPDATEQIAFNKPEAAVILELEQRRCAAIVAGDHATLSRLLDDQLVHVHGTGKVDDKKSYLDGIGGRYVFQFVRRGELSIRLHAGLGIVVGDLEQSFTDLQTGQRRVVVGVSSQCWLRRSQEWKLLHCHNSFLIERPVL